MAQPFSDAAGWHPGPIVLRSSWQRVVVPGLANSLLPFVVPVVLATMHHQPRAPYTSWELLPVPLAVAASLLGLWAERRKYLALHAGSLSLRAGWRKREIAAADIVAVTLVREYGTRVVTLWTRDGKAHRVGVAGRGHGLIKQSFDRDWHLIGQWWLANGGMPLEQQWTPPAIAAGWVPNGFDWRPQT